MISVIIAEGALFVCVVVIALWCRSYRPMLRAWASTYGIDLLKRNNLISPRDEGWLRERGYR